MRDLLALSRVDDVVIGSVDVLAVVESTLALARKDIVERAVLTFEHEAVAPAAGSVARLGQVLLNLVTNALESMRSNVRDDNRIRIVVRPSAAGGAVVEVSDNGVGIPVEHASRIFDPFFTTKPPGKRDGTRPRDQSTPGGRDGRPAVVRVDAARGKHLSRDAPTLGGARPRCERAVMRQEATLSAGSAS